MHILMPLLLVFIALFFLLSMCYGKLLLRFSRTIPKPWFFSFYTTTGEPKVAAVYPVAFLFTTLFIFIGLALLIKNNEYQINGEATIAVISRIESEFKPRPATDGSIDHHVYVDYFVKEKKYSGEINLYTVNMKIGQPIKIYYDKNNPEKIMAEQSFIAAAMTLIAAALSLFFLRLTIKTVQQSKKNRMPTQQE